MNKLMKNFLVEEDGVQVVEMVLIIGVLVAVAILFGQRIKIYVGDLMDAMFTTPTF